MPQVRSCLAKWAPTLAKFGILLLVLLLINFGVIAIAGPEIWSQSGYIFGQDVRTTLYTLMFIEGGFLLVLGSLWASGPMNNVRYGKFEKTHGSITKEDWEQRRKMAEQPNEVVVVSLLTGSVVLIASIVLFLT